MLDITIRDRFASPREVAAALDAWPADGWHAYATGKRVTVPGATLPLPLATLVYRMAGLKFGNHVVPDLGLWGAGLHEMPPGEGLGWHTDAERHPVLSLARTRSGVLYLCGDGDLFFDDGASVSPAPGRLVVFDGAAPHCVGTVTETRRAICLFWYQQPAATGTTRATFEDD